MAAKGAYARKFSALATYFVYFHDNLWDSVAHHNFTEMRRLAWGQPPQLCIVDQELSVKHPEVIELVRQPSGRLDHPERDPLT